MSEADRADATARDRVVALVNAAARPPVEHYARCSVTVGDVVIEPGIELREGDHFRTVVDVLEDIARSIGQSVERLESLERLGCANDGRVHLIRQLHTYFEPLWPGRAFFIEIHDAKLNRWSQTYLPYGQR